MVVKPSHPSLAWPRSDGVGESKYPDASTPEKGDEAWYEEAGEDTAKYQLYSTKIAEHIAGELNLGVDVTKQAMPLPEGYKLFAHRKKQPSGDIRTDYYLYGSSHVGKFRSVPEFLDHASWLFDTSKSLDDHSTCTCKYSKGGNRRQSMPGSATKRPSGSSPLKEGSVKKKRAVEAVNDSVLPAVVPERAEELGSQRRFRRGELIWFRINTITPPSTINTPGLTPITHWPGLLSNIPLKTKVINDDDTASASASSAWTAFGGSAPSTLDSAKQTTIHYYEYHIRPLGMFSPQDEVIKDGKDLLPWQCGCELLGGESGWDAIGFYADQVLKKGVKKEAQKLKNQYPNYLSESDPQPQPQPQAGPDGEAVEPPKPHREEVENGLMKGWKANWGKRIRFIELSDKYDDAVFRLSVALKTGSAISTNWVQTDKIDTLPGDRDISAEDVQLILDQKKTLYQGLWWGGERIWLDDLVRLKKKRRDIPTNVLSSPSDGALDRAVFFKIRVIAIEVTNITEANSTGWRCILYGDVFELAKEGADGVQSDVELNDRSLVRHYKPAKGYAYRQLNETDSEVTVDVVDVAGRVYPDLLDGTTQNYFIDPSNPSDDQGRVQPGPGVTSLAGLLCGTTVATKSTEWEEDLYSIVQKTTKTCEVQLKEYYIDIVRGDLGLPKVPQNGVNGEAGTIAEALGGLGDALKA
ncbi:uncharacterized protein L201_002882 [Kwoniella dendrophila CBS 6074]|uniref:Cryptic loci regulator 2 N-terminal domain-containing protein n=1 Tax=Kwoniella dendrophila CBS 6074 TaxID=1295534 RepID=A0AAX4JTS7_9TREE